MPSLRRAYVYLVSAIALEVTVWALIALLRALVVPGEALGSNLALQIAVLVVAAPIFALHWRQAERLAAADPAERASGGRQFYRHGMALLLLVPALLAAHQVLTWLFTLGLGLQPEFEEGQQAHRQVIAILILLVVLFWHRRLMAADGGLAAATRAGAPFRRLGLLLLTVIGLFTWANAVGGLLTWLLSRPAGSPWALPALAGAGLAELLAAVPVGLGLWLGAGKGLAAEAAAGREGGRGAALPGAYLHLALLGSSGSALAGAAILLTGLWRMALALPPRGDWRSPAATLLVGGLVWAFHHRLRGRALAAAPAVATDRTDAAAQANLVALYPYLMAAVGMGATLAGLSGLVTVLLRGLLGPGLQDADREQLAWSLAVLLLGLPLWALVARQVQAWARQAGEAGEAARAALPRKLYLYLFLLVSSLSFLIAAVYLVFRLVERLLGQTPSTENFGLNLAQAGALALIAAGAWLLHLAGLRGDGDLAAAGQARRLAAWPTLLLEPAAGVLAATGEALEAALRRELPELPLRRLALDQAAADDISGAALLLLPAGALLADPARAAALAAAPGRRLYLPDGSADWVGIEPWDAEDLAEHLARAVGQVIEGRPVRLRRPLGLGSLIVAGLGTAALLAALGVPLWLFFRHLVGGV